MRYLVLAQVLVLGLIASPAAAGADTLPVAAAGADALPAAASGAAMDYAKAESWLCRPDANGPCDTDLSKTRFIAPPVPIPGPPAPPGWQSAVDCFYVYPTVSRQPAGNADGSPTDDERYVVQQQFARFVEVCRRFAPLYRQTTLATIGSGVKGDAELAYGDVRAAFRQYLAADNGGRGVLLLGHSQGARHLRRLIAEEVVGKPVEQQIVAAYAIGFPVPVADAADGVAPPMLKPCTRAQETGCLVAYASFHAASPPAADNRFAGRPGPGLRVACVNPAALLGQPTLRAILPARPRQAGSAAIGSGVTLAPGPVEAPSYELAGMIEARCVRTAETDYLAVSSPVAAVDAGLKRIDAALPGWGLHLVDINLALGSLVQLAGAQSASWLVKQAQPR
jgi:hypothetical protein